MNKRTARFEMYKDVQGEYRFRLKAANGMIIAVGEGYTAKDNCKKTIEVIQKIASNAKVWDIINGELIEELPAVTKDIPSDVKGMKLKKQFDDVLKNSSEKELLKLRVDIFNSRVDYMKALNNCERAEEYLQKKLNTYIKEKTGESLESARTEKECAFSRVFKQFWNKLACI